MNPASCCVLSYNRPDFLRECVGSLVSGARAPLELIVHDDGSTDGAVYPLLGELASMGATVLMNKPGHNQGVGTAINRMFKIATGDPLIKIDQDLIFHPNWLEHVQALLAGNRDRSLANAAAREWASEPRIGLLGLLHYHHEPVDSAKTIKADHGAWTEHTHILGSAFALTREAWETFGPLAEHSEAFAEDWERMKEIEASGLMVNALPPSDLCFNRGFGIGPSTVVVAEGQVASIHHGPFTMGVQT
jgi:glycosyltransferase involved in cell wall biosynthesis